MLLELKIDNLAVIEHATFVPSRGLCALTGETGAGKSVVLSALGLLLGARARADLVRADAIVGAVHGRFDVSACPGVAAVLAAHGLDGVAPDGADPPPHVLDIQRTLPVQGPSRALVQGQVVRLQVLRDLAPHLVQVVSQHAQHMLLEDATHLELLDRYAGHDSLREQMAAAHQAWQQAVAAAASLATAVDQRDERLAWLDFQLDELGALGLKDDEVAALRAESSALRHGARLEAGLTRVLEVLDGDSGGAGVQVSRASTDLLALVELDRALEPLAEALAEASCQLDEAVRQLHRHADREPDPGRIEVVEGRLGAADRLARRHRCDPEDLVAVTARLQAERDALDALDDQLAAARKHAVAAQDTAVQLATTLTKGRRAASDELGGRVAAELERLAMPGARFAVTVSQDPTAELGPTGADHVVFELSANPGEPPRSLSRVASGGELSRVLLAVHAVLAERSPAPTLVLDEIDAGLGGAAATALAARLDALSGTGPLRQVLCVTHSPAVAGRADSHARVVKHVRQGRTRSTVDLLDAEGRLAELTRMLAGTRQSAGSQTLARELLGARAPAASRRRQAG